MASTESPTLGSFPSFPTYQEDPLSSSISGPSSRAQSSQIAKTYRQAANLFLTRRLPESLSTIEPIISPQPAHAPDGLPASEQSAAPIALASRSSRIKVWSFYLTFLNSVVELGPEEGKHAFGSTKWKALVAKARDGTVWDDIVRDGYGGIEGNVDADVVVNLATLLLAHSPSQKLNQSRLETYLSSVAHPTFDITSHLSSPSRYRRASTTPGTNTPRDLQTSLKLLELYTLHVLPRNGEWEYAREFIMMSEVLDDERKEAFLQALHGLREEQREAAERERDIQAAQERQLEAQRADDERRRRDERLRAEEEARLRDAAKRHHQHQHRGAKAEGQPRDGLGQHRPKAGLGRPDGAQAAGGTAARPRQAPKEGMASRDGAAGVVARAGALLAHLQSLVLAGAQSLGTNPVLLLRTVLFVLAFALAFGRREMRVRIKRMVDRAWMSVRRTVGMGAKVSYI